MVDVRCRVQVCSQLLEVGQFDAVAASLPRQMAAQSRLYIKLAHYPVFRPLAAGGHIVYTSLRFGWNGLHES